MRTTGEVQELEGTEKSTPGYWGDYPLDNLAIRSENRTAFDVIRRVQDGRFILDPEFQRDMVWDAQRQSRLIESILLRIPLPVFYVAEDEEGRLIVVDGLQRLTTIKRFIENDLKLKLPDRKDLDGKRHKDLELRLQGRVDDCQLLFFIIDFTVPDGARLDIFERVNSGVELTRQQMRNALFNGPATIFLREAASTDLFVKATNNGLDTLKMQDREFVNRFCSFMLLDRSNYRNDMDAWLAGGLRELAKSEAVRNEMGEKLRLGLQNNYVVFGKNSFRKHQTPEQTKTRLNAALFDVMSTGLSKYSEQIVQSHKDQLRAAFFRYLDMPDFDSAISSSPNSNKAVLKRFEISALLFKEVFGDSAT